MKTIAILGMDGTGKSTILKEFSDKQQSIYSTQYMGMKEWETKIAKLKYEKNKFRYLPGIGVIWIELIFRYFKSSLKRKKIIFDRYPLEMQNDFKGLKKIMFKIFLVYLFPRPDKIIYLKCSVKTSLSRKDDIDNVDEFRIRKNNLEKKIILKLKCLEIDTEKNNIENVLKIMINYIEDRNLNEIKR